MEGQLRGEQLSVAVTTECAHCARPMHLEIDSGLECRVEEEAAAPVIFIPLVNFSRLTERRITDVF